MCRYTGSCPGSSAGGHEINCCSDIDVVRARHVADNEMETHTSDAYSMPTKPSLARNSANRNSSKRKVPPIAVGGGGGKAYDDVMGGRSARDNGLYEDIDGVYEDDSDEVSFRHGHEQRSKSMLSNRSCNIAGALNRTQILIEMRVFLCTIHVICCRYLFNIAFV